MSGFFEEVKRRKVYRVAAAYVIAAGGIIQLASAAFPAWELPNWALRLVIVLLLVGFPIALILAWAFDVTAQGIKTTPTAAPRRQVRRNVIMLATAGVVMSAAVGFFVLPRASAHKIDKSIAVLPFQNLSDDPQNAYFADGIQDDVLTSLSKIGDLRVISRTSVMQYRDKAANVRDIGKALGVSNVLEGQSDLAQKIAEALQAKLSPGEKSMMERKPTENGEAYLAFVQAHNLSCAFEDLEKLKQSEQLYARAIELDPNFALAIARYSQLESWFLHDIDRTPERREKARTLAERALQLQPDLPEAHLALGFSYYYGDNNYDAALREFEIAQRGLPNESEVYLAIGAIQRRQGKWAESTANLQKAASLNPKDTWPLQNLAFNYQMLRDFRKANQTVDHALALDPKAFGLLEVKSKLAIVENGDFGVAERALAALQSANISNAEKLKAANARADIFLLERKYQEGLQAAENLPDDQIAAFPGHLWSKYYYIGFARKALHDDTGARAAFLKAKTTLEDQLKRSPDNPDIHIQLAKVLAFLSEKDSALAEAQRATELIPQSDAFGGPEIMSGVAEVYATLGENDRAIEILDGLLSRPSGVTAQALKVNPIWDPLRNDPRFQGLIDKYGAKA